MAGRLEEWSENLRREVFEYWKSNYSHWNPGFQVWYGPVDSSKDTLILGIQPGGDESAFERPLRRFEAGDFSLDTEHHYLASNFDLANATRKVVPREIIERSVKTNINFFRAPSQTIWKNGLPEESRNEIEKFCFSKVSETMKRIDPELVITEGTASVFDQLKSAWDLSTDCQLNHEISDNRTERLVCVSRNAEFDVVGLKHPSSGRGLGSKEYERMRKTVVKVANESVLD